MHSWKIKVNKGNVTLMNHEELLFNLEDNEWPLTTINHDRLIARAIVIDDEEKREQRNC